MALVACGTVAAAYVIAILGHGAMVHPKPRNAIDGDLPFFDKGACAHGPNQQFCYPCNCGNFTVVTVDNVTGNSWIGCSPGARANMSGQSCLWFSQGCTIGCDTCDNSTQHTMGESLCGKKMKPTLPKYAWTMNLWAVEGSVNDSYAQHPWRAPGFAPVVDVCGMSGGDPNPGGGAAVFATTKFNKQGQLGSQVLQKGPSAATWSAGDTVEVSWGIRANHGGGYIYRLCPASEPLTEDCMMKMPLEFAGQSRLLYNDGTYGPYFNRTTVSTGTNPPGSTWAMNPIPRIDFDSQSSGQPKGWTGCKSVPSPAATSQPISPECKQFKSPACDEFDPTTDTPWHPIPGAPLQTGDVEGKCSGDFISAQIIDHVVIPKDISPGDYVLGLRWDCEETAQIWSSCADVTITR